MRLHVSGAGRLVWRERSEWVEWIEIQLERWESIRSWGRRSLRIFEALEKTNFSVCFE